LVAAQQQVAILTETIARLQRSAIEREHEFTKPRHFAPPEVACGTMLHEVPRSAAQCSPWKRADFCLFEGVDQDATAHVERLLTKRIRLRKGDVLYRVGGRFNALYAIRTGSCKTLMLAKDGHGQIAGFYMTGEIIGLDGIATDIHECQATALEDTEICSLPFDEIENLAHRNARFQHNLHRLLTHRYARARTLMIVLGTMSGDQRLAVFLLDLSQRYQARGYSSCEFVLRMTREEIGSYLGLKLETVSRLFSRLQRDGLLQVEGRAVKLLDRVALTRIVEGGT
jgi:CRP/FNR family transcriptional regulator, anaerobic regulatory protein